jgi:hypothetical protein
MGRDRLFCRLHALRWMREHGLSQATTPRSLAEVTARAFDVWAGLVENLEPGEHWIFDLAVQALDEQEARRARAA